jgi:hypothetical protein
MKPMSDEKLAEITARDKAVQDRLGDWLDQEAIESTDRRELLREVNRMREPCIWVLVDVRNDVRWYRPGCVKPNTVTYGYSDDRFCSECGHRLEVLR